VGLSGRFPLSGSSLWLVLLTTQVDFPKKKLWAKVDYQPDSGVFSCLDGVFEGLRGVFRDFWAHRAQVDCGLF